MNTRIDLMDQRFFQTYTKTKYQLEFLLENEIRSALLKKKKTNEWNNNKNEPKNGSTESMPNGEKTNGNEKSVTKVQWIKMTEKQHTSHDLHQTEWNRDTQFIGDWVIDQDVVWFSRSPETFPQIIYWAVFWVQYLSFCHSLSNAFIAMTLAVIRLHKFSTIAKGFIPYHTTIPTKHFVVMGIHTNDRFERHRSHAHRLLFSHLTNRTTVLHTTTTKINIKEEEEKYFLMR